MLLHGWGVSNSIWENFSKSLMGSAAVSAPCLYTLANEAKDYKLESIAAMLKEDIKQDCVVVGWSLGGLLAMQLAGHCNKVKAIILVASPPCFINKSGWEGVLNSKAIDDLHRYLLDDPDAALDYFAGLIAHGDMNQKQSIKTIRKNRAAVTNKKILSRWLVELIEQDQRKNFSALDIPIKYILGKNDSLIGTQTLEQIKQLRPEAECSLINDCGHAPFITKQEETMALINGFINERFK